MSDELQEENKNVDDNGNPIGSTFLSEPWTPVDGDELKGFIERVTPVDGKYKLSEDTAKIAWKTLPFYEHVAMIRIKDSSWSNQALTLFYLTDEGNLFRINGTSPPIHEVNAKAPIRITEENVLDYLRFFCYFVRGEDGPFYLAETMDDPIMPKDMDDTTRSVLEGSMRPATLEGMDENGNFLCEAIVFYANGLFIAKFSVQPSGMIEMLSDEGITADLKSRVDSPIS